MSTARRALEFSVAMGRSVLSSSTSAVVWMSPAVTSAGPRTSNRNVTGSSASTRRTRSFRFRMMSVTSSLMPGRVENSWRASSKRTWVTAAPGIDDSNVRRSELPSVWPKPGSRGPTAKRWRLASSSPTGSTVGRWMISKGFSWERTEVGGSELLGVELDDELLAHGHVDVLAERQVAHRDRLLLVAGLEPRRDEAVDRVDVVADHD